MARKGPVAGLLGGGACGRHGAAGLGQGDPAIRMVVHGGPVSVGATIVPALPRGAPGVVEPADRGHLAGGLHEAAGGVDLRPHRPGRERAGAQLGAGAVDGPGRRVP